MLLVQRLGTEASRAEATVEQVVALVDLNVGLQVGQTRERAHADLALQPMLVLHVLRQVRGGGEDFVALAAAEILGAGVDVRQVGAKLS